MTKYIPLDTLVAEIERRMKRLTHTMSKFYYASNYNKWKLVAKEYRSLISYINTIGVKEVDIDKILYHRRNIGFTYPEDASEYQKCLVCYRQGIEDVLKAQNSDYHGFNGEADGFTNEIRDVTDSIQEEPVSEELEEAAKEYSGKSSHPLNNAFKTGAKWHEKQMMAKAIDGYVIEDIEEGNGDFLLSADYLPKSMGLKDRQKVKVIVIKEG